MMLRLCATALALIALATTPALAQEKPTVSKYLNEGYEVLRAEFGSAFLQFMLKKDKTLVWCTVLVQSGETSSCRTIK
jgi:hypothetical protein